MKSNVQFLIALCVSIFATNLAAQNKQTVLIPKCDTYVTCNSKESTNFSSDTFLKTCNQIKNASQKFESYVQFEIPKKLFKKRDEITKAKFRIMESGKGMQGEKEFFVSILSENGWDETLSGKIRGELKLGSAEVAKTIKKFTKKVGETDKWYEIDVTELVKNAPEHILSFRIYNKTKVDDEDSLLFYSSEVKGKGPELIIE